MSEEHEIWVDIVLSKSKWRHQVSNLGRIRFKSPFQDWRIKRSKPDTCGYPIIRVGPHRGYKVYRVHILVAKTFVENQDSKPEVNHKDGVKTNNRADNLEWVTTKENWDHAVRTGLAVGSKIGEERFHLVLKLREQGLTNRQIGDLLEVGRNVVDRFFEGHVLRRRGLVATRSIHNKAPVLA